MTVRRFTPGLLALPLLGAAATLDAPLSGGETTVVIPRAQLSDRGAFSFPAPNLSMTRRGDHFMGNSFFQNPWVTAPASTKSRDGLGPLFNTMSCQSCHVRDGRGRPPLEDEEMLSMLVRISVPSDGSAEQEAHRARYGVIPDPIYGDQIQNNAILDLAPEARVRTEWREVEGQYADGTAYTLREPVFHFDDPGYGQLSAGLQTSGRVAPPMIGVGLLDTVSHETLAAIADPEDADGDGISGRFNQVWNVGEERMTPGRFGWKCEQPNARQQVASAFAGDIGISSSLFPGSSLTASQSEVVDVPDGGKPEVTDEILDLVTFYTKTLAVPARRGYESAFIQEGEQLFREAKCAACHVETLVTGDDPDFPELSGQTIHAYTDLLLHDMGEGLADGRPVFEATASEWRTPPLWGLGLLFNVNRHTDLLHDGRARTFEEAILWHGGEAEASREAFRDFDAQQRRKLVAFLKSL
ncbi:MAG: di-heme oxidoredictase family protein [Planctomycetota bacterium]